jgi:hypothetical protein
MREPIRKALIAVALAAAAWYGWQWLFPGDEARIAAVLERIADAVQEEGSQPAAILARAARIARELAPEVTVDAGPPFERVAGREALAAAAARARSRVQNLEIRFPDMDIVVSPGRDTALARVTAEARFVSGGSGQVREARELEIGFVRREGEWLVGSVVLVRAIDRLEAR